MSPDRSRVFNNSEEHGTSFAANFEIPRVSATDHSPFSHDKNDSQQDDNENRKRRRQEEHRGGLGSTNHL